MTSTSARIVIKAWGFLSKRRGLYLFKLLLTFALLSGLIFYLRSHDLLAAFRQVRHSAIVLACALLPLNLGLQFLKWHYLLRSATGQPLAPRLSFFSLLAGFPLGLLTPGRWGELGRALFLPQLHERRVMVLAAFDKVFDLFLGMLLGAFALLYLIIKEMLPQVLLGPVVVLLCCFVWLNVLVLQPRALKGLTRILYKRRATKRSTLRVLTRISRQNLCVVWLISFLFVLTYSLQFVLLLRGFVAISFFEGYIGGSAAFLVKSLLPIALGDLGVREGAAAFFFARMGLSPQAAFDAGLLLFIINLLAPSLLGTILIWKYQTTARRAKLDFAASGLNESFRIE